MDRINQTQKVVTGFEIVEVENLLMGQGELGVLSISVLQRETRSAEEGWSSYDRTLKAIAKFLRNYMKQNMRSSDMLLNPVVAGNTFVVFLCPPREARSLDLIDLTRVRQRLSESLNKHLTRSLPNLAVEQFGVYVGGSLIRHDSRIDCRRNIFRSIESAFADALSQKRVEIQRHRSRLEAVLAHGGLEMAFQPVVDLTQRKILGYEALTRVATDSFPSPDLLFRAAQEHGALFDLERLSRSTALRSLPPFEEDQLLFLNVEPESIHDPELVGPAFLKQLNDAGLRPNRIVLELTEHVAVTDFGAFREKLNEHRELGFRIAMDDVGSGYAGLQAIAELSPDYLKIDMALVRDVHLHTIKQELIRTIVRFTDRTGTILIAEGVENVDELQALMRFGVRCAQGYLFARPEKTPAQPDWSILEPCLV